MALPGAAGFVWSVFRDLQCPSVTGRAQTMLRANLALARRFARLDREKHHEQEFQLFAEDGS